MVETDGKRPVEAWWKERLVHDQYKSCSYMAASNSKRVSCATLDAIWTSEDASGFRKPRQYPGLERQTGTGKRQPQRSNETPTGWQGRAGVQPLGRSIQNQCESPGFLACQKCAKNLLILLFLMNFWRVQCLVRGEKILMDFFCNFDH